MAGKLAPFIELGVGFNPELTSRENVVLNGVMMGLGRREARHRLDAVLDFAELREFADLKLKNYSSGMMVRLAFAVLVEADADIMLIDEVLAVGDAAFAQRCMDVLKERRRAGRTLVLVTHDMATVQELCHRAMLIHDGERDYVGDPAETAARYYRVNFESAAGQRRDVEASGVPDVNVSVVDAWLGAPARAPTGSSRDSGSSSTSSWRRGATWTRRSSASTCWTRSVRPSSDSTVSSACPPASPIWCPRAGASGSPAQSTTRSCRGGISSTATRRARGRRATTACTSCGCWTSRCTATIQDLERVGRRRRRGRAGARRAMTDAPLELREVRGPSALGGGWRRALDLLYLLAVTEFKRNYLGTALGYVWSLARPLLLYAVLLVVFTQAFDLGDTVRNYPVLLLFNIVLFGLFQEATSQAVGSLVSQEGVVRKTQFPRLVIPLAVVLTSLFNFAVNLVVVFGFFLAAGISPRWTWLLFGLVVAALLVLTTATATLLSALYPRFRDTGIIWSVAVTALFYATPVLYPLELVSGTLARVLSLNPLTPLFELARKWVVDPQAPGPAAETGAAWLLIPAALFVAVCVLAVWVFNREAPRIAEEL